MVWERRNCVIRLLSTKEIGYLMINSITYLLEEKTLERYIRIMIGVYNDMCYAYKALCNVLNKFYFFDVIDQ